MSGERQARLPGGVPRRDVRVGRPLRPEPGGLRLLDGPRARVAAREEGLHRQGHLLQVARLQPEARRRVQRRLVTNEWVGTSAVGFKLSLLWWITVWMRINVQNNLYIYRRMSVCLSVTGLRARRLDRSSPKFACGALFQGGVT